MAEDGNISRKGGKQSQKSVDEPTRSPYSVKPRGGGKSGMRTYSAQDIRPRSKGASLR